MSSRGSRRNGRETKLQILKFAQAELEEHGPVKFNILRVIEESGISRSSIYHHFGDRDGVIAAVEVERFIAELRFSNELLRLALSSVTSGKKAFELLEQALLAASSPLGRQQRAHRIAVIAVAQTNPSLQQLLVQQSLVGDEYLSETLEIAQARGLIQMKQPSLSIARFIASIFVGRVTVDGFESSEIDESWVSTAVSVLEHLLNPIN